MYFFLVVIDLAVNARVRRALITKAQKSKVRCLCVRFIIFQIGKLLIFRHINACERYQNIAVRELYDMRAYLS